MKPGTASHSGSSRRKRLGQPHPGPPLRRRGGNKARSPGLLRTPRGSKRERRPEGRRFRLGPLRKKESGNRQNNPTLALHFGEGEGTRREARDCFALPAVQNENSGPKAAVFVLVRCGKKSPATGRTTPPWPSPRRMGGKKLKREVQPHLGPPLGEGEGTRRHFTPCMIFWISGAIRNSRPPQAIRIQKPCV